MVTTKFNLRFFWVTFLFALMPSITALSIYLIPDHIETKFRYVFFVFFVLFLILLVYRLVFQSRSLCVTDDGKLQVRRLFGLLVEGEVELSRFDGYFVDYVRRGRRGRDVWGYLCLVKQDMICTKLCFNDYEDFDLFLSEAIEKYIPKILYRKKE